MHNNVYRVTLGPDALDRNTVLSFSGYNTDSERPLKSCVMTVSSPRPDLAIIYWHEAIKSVELMIAIVILRYSVVIIIDFINIYLYTSYMYII